MITDPKAILFVLVVIEVIILSLEKPLEKIYRYIPAMVWMYFVPMIMTTAGVLPISSSVYDYLNLYVLPAALLLIMLSSSIKGISRMGFQSLIAMLTGSSGIILGSILGYVIFKPYLPSDMCGALAALSASWMGGSANMMGVFESFGAKPELLSPIIIVDTIVAYLWLPLLIYLSRYQERFDRWNNVSDEIMDYMQDIAERIRDDKKHPMTIRSVLLMICIVIPLVYISTLTSKFLPLFEGISSFIWVIIIVTFMGTLLSLTRAHKIGGSSKAGYLLLYLFLISVGAKSSLTDIYATPAVFGFGMVTISVHIILLLAVIRVMKMPMFLFASASMANMGGTASASVVAGAYNRSLVPIAIIISVLGYVVGTYGGLLVGVICSML